MAELLSKAEIDGTGTCWVEFNVSGTDKSFDHWQAESRYCSFVDYEKIEGLFSSVLPRYNQFGPNLLTLEKIEKLLLALGSRARKRPAVLLIGELMSFFEECREEGRVVWLLCI